MPEIQNHPGEAAQLSHSEILSIFAGLILAMLLAALDQTIVGPAMPTIGRALGDIEYLPWVISAYLLAATAVAPLYGKLSDIHGRRIVLLWGIGLFIAGSIACALAPTMLFLAVARGLQGIGGGGLLSLAQTIIADLVAPRERARYQGYIVTVFAASSLAGPVLGGFFAEHIHWSMIFWINVPLGLAAFLMTNDKLKKLPRFERPHELDFLGAGFLVVATLTMLLALTWGGSRYSWVSPQIFGLMIVSCAFWGLFVWRLLHAHEPLIPLKVLSDQVVLTGTGAAFFAMGVFIGLTLYVPIYFEGIIGLSVSNSGLALIPLTVGTVCGATTGGRMMMHMKHYKRTPMVGLAFAIAAVGLLVVYPSSLSLTVIEILLAITSFGLGTILPVTTISIQNAVAPHDMGTATASMGFFRQLGGAIIAAVFGTIILNAASVPVTGAAHAQMFTAVHGDELAALTIAFQAVFGTAALGLLAALVLLVVMEERPLRGRVSVPETAPEA